jgi:hypothetical protein
MDMNKQNRTKTKWAALALLSIIPALTFAQNDAGGGDQGGGGDSAAEAAVTSGSVSKPATAESGSIEGNPIVNYVRADPTGASFSLLQNLDINELRQSARETGGDFTKLKENVSHVKLGKKLTEVITARQLGVNLSDLKKDLTTILKQVASGITVAKINAMDSSALADTTKLLASGITVAKINAMDSSALAATTKLLASGLSATKINLMTPLGLSTALDVLVNNAGIDLGDYVVDNTGFSNKLTDLGFSESNIASKSGLKDLHKHVTDSSSETPVPLETAAITAIDNLLSAGITITKYLALRTDTFTTAQIQLLLDSGFTATYLNGESDLTTLLALTITSELSATELGQMATLINSPSYTLANIKVLIAAEFTFSDLSGKSAGELAYILKNLSSTIADKDKFLTKATASTWSFNSITNADFDSIIDDATWFSDFSTKLEAAGKIADIILTERDEHNINENVINVKSLADDGYTTELIRILGKYGAIGSAEDDGNALSDNLANSVFGQHSSSENLDDIVKSSSADWIADLAKLGAGTFHDEDKDSTVLDVKLSNVTLSTGSDIAFSNGATVDVSDILEPATNGRKVHVIGAAKDLTIKGDVTFTNTRNTAEDHALAIGAADDVYFRSEYSNANSADYNDPDPITVKYTGSNLGIGSNDTMRLVNVNMEAGGNLALASLDELHISTSDGREDSTFTVGNGGNSPDNVYLYANELIQINGLNFSGNLDDVYMEAVVINLRDVTFPANAEVMLRGGDGSLHFDTYASPSRGVNLTNVVHQGIGSAALQDTDFEGSAGHVNSVKRFENNTPKIRIRGQ